MRPQPEEVLKLAARMIDLKRDLANAEKQWNILFPESPARTITAVATERTPHVRQKSGVGRILAMLAESPETDFDPASMATSMDIPLGTTRTILSKLVSKGLVEKRGYGKYGALRTKEKEAISKETTS